MDSIACCTALPRPLSQAGGEKLASSVPQPDAETVRKAFKSKLLVGAVTRNRWVRNM